MIDSIGIDWTYSQQSRSVYGGYDGIYPLTCWKIQYENIGDFAIKLPISSGFLIAMFDYRRVSNMLISLAHVDFKKGVNLTSKDLD